MRRLSSGRALTATVLSLGLASVGLAPTGPAAATGPVRALVEATASMAATSATASPAGRSTMAITNIAAPRTAGATALHTATSTTPITHIIVLMQENHSFDSELGDWCNQSGRCDGIPAQVTLSDGSMVTPGTSPDIVPNIGHSVAAQTAAIDGGAMNGWQNVKGCAGPTYACVSYYPASQVPNLAALATTYGVEQRAFTLNNSPSWGGHLDEFAATTDGFTGNNPYVPKGGTAGPGWGCDSRKVATMLRQNGNYVAPQPSCVPDYALGLPNGGAFAPTVAAQVPTILTEMDAAGVPWNIYAATAGGSAYYWSGCPSFASCLYTGEDSHLVDSGQFFADAAAGTLPSVSFLTSAGSNSTFSQHNRLSNAAGDNWIGKVASAVMASPDWSSTALIITYDDCGCFYDQVSPPLAPDGRQMGPRVPFLVISPYAKPGYVDSTPTSSTGSILALIESTFGLPALGANDAGGYNLSGMFNFAQAPQAPRQMTWRKLPQRDYKLNPAILREGT